MAEYYEREALKKIAMAVNTLIFDLRTNMTSVSRYVRDNREKHPTLTEGQFIDRNLEYKRLAEQAVDNILSCLDSNEYLRSEEGLEALVRQAKPATLFVDATLVSHGRWIDSPHAYKFFSPRCSVCHQFNKYHEKYKYCPNCGAKMDLEEDDEQPEHSGEEKKMIPMYLGNCDEGDCEHWSWCGDSYGDRNTECFCRLNGKSVIRREAEEKHILCPLGKMMEDENDDG